MDRPHRPRAYDPQWKWKGALAQICHLNSQTGRLTRTVCVAGGGGFNGKHAGATDRRIDLFGYMARPKQAWYSPVRCDGVTLEVPPLEKGARGIFKSFFPLNTSLLAAGIIY